MSFLNQALLFGLFAVSIPIIIHLMNRRRFRRVPWAAMRFLNVSVEQNQRRMKLEDLLLLFLRCALLALLAFAVARPVVKGLTGLPGSKVAVAVILDTSASMGTAEGDETRLDQARAAAVAIVDGLPSGSSVAISTPFRPDEPTNDRKLAQRRVAEVGPTDRHGDLLTALEAASRTLDGQAAAEKEIYLVTDGHSEEWSAFAALDEKLRELSAGSKVHLVLVGSPTATNLGISRLAPSGALPAVNEPFRLDVDVTNHGIAIATDVRVTLLVDNQPLDEPWVIDEIRPGRSESATLYATLPSAGYHRVTVALGADAVPFDDRRTLVLRAVDDVKVLLVDGEPGGEPRESETFFLGHALAPVPEEQRASYPVQPTVVPVSELAGKSLEGYDAVVLANVSDVSLSLAERLTSYVEAGGGLVVFSGQNIRAEVYNTLLHTKHGLLPATFVPGDSLDSGRELSLVPTETNPLGLDAEMLATARFREASRLALSERSLSAEGGSGSSARIALRWDDGTPALIESEFGLGKVFLFGSTADTAWSDLAIKPVFVPFINRLLGSIVQHQDTSLNLRAGDLLSHRVGAELAGREATVSEVDNPKALGRLTTIEERQGDAVLRFAQTDRAGAYQATIAGQPTPVLFAARPSERESSVDLIGAEQTARLAESTTVIRWDSGRGAGEFGANRAGSELWLPLLFLVIAIAAVEMSLAQWFSRPK